MPAVVRKLGARRIQVEVHEREPYGRRIVPALHWATADSLSLREIPCSRFHECMEMTVSGFLLRPWRHSIGAAYAAFPEGVWYGEIDGYQVGAPCVDAEGALRSALNALRNGGYATALRSHIQCLEGWLVLEGAAADRASAELPQLKKRFADVERRLCH